MMKGACIIRKTKGKAVDLVQDLGMSEEEAACRQMSLLGKVKNINFLINIIIDCSAYVCFLTLFMILTEC